MASMKHVLWILGLVIACQSPAPAPKDSVRGFVDAWNRRDLMAAMKFVHGGTLQQDAFAPLIKGNDWPVIRLSNLSETIDGATATVNATLNLAGSEKPEHDAVKLTKVGGEWLIEPAVEAGHMQIIAGLAYALGHPQEIAQARVAAVKTNCLSHLKQIALAALMEASDHDDTFKFTPKNFKEKLSPYLGNTKLLTCPLDSDGTTSYAFNPAVLNIRQSKIKDPRLTVLAYEGKGGKLDFRHAGKANVAFCDGHAKSVDPQEAKKLRWKP